MGQLTSHVLDTAAGRPAAGLTIELYRVDGGGDMVVQSVTNADGRCDQPLLVGETFKCGVYELVFLVGDYLDTHHPDQGRGRFLDRVPVRFTIDSPDQHYHVPLLLSPYGYSTYRGS